MFGPVTGGGKWIVGVGVYLMNQSWLLLACSDPVIDGDLEVSALKLQEWTTTSTRLSFSALSRVSFPELSPPHFSSAPRHPASPPSWLCCPRFLSPSHPSVCVFLLLFISSLSPAAE